MLTGVLLKILATLGFTVMGIAVRAAAPACPVAEIVFFRSSIALVVLAIWLRLIGGFPAQLRTARPGAHLLRSLSGASAMLCNFVSLSLLPFADATAYFYSMPIFVTLIAALGLGERVSLLRWVAVAIGFAGVVAMLSDHLGLADLSHSLSGHGLGAVVALGGAFSSALSIVQMRRLTASEHTGAIVFYFTCLTTAFGALILALGSWWPHGAPGAQFFATQAYVAPDAHGWLALVVVGVAGGLAQIFNTQSYRFADASLLASFDYLAMFWALLVSIAFFSEWPTTSALAGASLIAASGLLAILGERRARRRDLALA